MSYMIGSLQKGIYSFSDYIQLHESIGPVETDYGVNMIFNDKEVLESTDTSIHTFFIFDSKLYDVTIHPKGNIGFGVSEEIPTSLDKLYITKFSDDKINTAMPIGVFNRVIYVLLELLKTYKRNVYYFTPANNSLFRLYVILFNNKSFKDKINKLGYTLSVDGNGVKFLITRI